VAVDTLRATRNLEAKGSTRDQAEVIAETIADTGLVTVKRVVDVLKWMVGVGIVLVAATLWQVFGLRGELAAVREAVGRLDGRMAAVESGLREVKQELTTVGSRVGAVETRLGSVESRLVPRP
jgi:hypothetical protein